MIRRLAAAAVTTLAVAAPAAATAATPAPDRYAPPPDPTVQVIDRVPVVQLDDGAGGMPYIGSTTSYNAGDWAKQLPAFVDSGTYGRELAQIDEIAARQLTRAGRRGGRRRGGHHDGGRKPAIVFDVDETLLSNYSAILADGFVYGPKSKTEAQDQIGKQIAATKRVYDVAKANGVTIFLITGRGEDVREPTAANLAREGFDGYQSLTLKPAGFEGTTVEYKAGARKAIEDQGYTILANVGDQFSDLAGGHAKRAYKLPNPFYYLP